MDDDYDNDDDYCYYHNLVCLRKIWADSVFGYRYLQSLSGYLCFAVIVVFGAAESEEMIICS